MTHQIHVSSAADVAALYIRSLITSEALPLGAKLTIASLASEIGVSSTPVREALKQLEDEGLVSIFPRRGVYIRDISPKEILQVYRIKESLEPLVAEWATDNATPSQRQEILNLSAKLTALADEGVTSEYVQVIEAWARLLLVIAASAPMQQIFEAIDGRIRLLRQRNLSQPGRMRKSAIEHQRIAEAIAQGDRSSAAAFAAEHVRSAREWVLRLLEPGAREAGRSASLGA